MKRIACLMLVLSIACAGCQVNTSNTNIETSLESQIAGLRENVTKLEGELSQVKIELKALHDKIIEFKADLETKIRQLRADIAKLEKEFSQIEEALLARINKLETDLVSQITQLRADITKLEGEISQTKEALLTRINKLETDLESQITELRENISKLKKATWWIWAAIAAIALIAGGVAVHRSRKDPKILKSNQGIKNPSSTDKLPDKEILLDLSNKNPDTISELEFSGLGLLGHRLSRILGTRFPREVRSDWLRVAAMHYRIVERIFSEATDTKDKLEAKVEPKDKSKAKTGLEDKLTLPEKLKLLTISRDCLCAAKITHVLAEAWRYVNQASETLSIIVKGEKECAELAERFEEWEPLLDRHLKNMYGKSLAQELKKHRNDAEAKETKESSVKTCTHLLHEIMKDICKDSQTEKLEKNQKDAQEFCAKICAHLLHKIMKEICKESQVEKLGKNLKDTQECRAKIRTHSRQWALINQANLFRICMSRGIAILFLLSSAVMLLTTFFITMRNPLGRPIRAPYHLCIAIYGWFGAALSILLGVRKLRPGAVNFRTLWLNLFLRLALGAGGAFVTYVIVCTPGLLDTSLNEPFQKVPGFIALGIVAGFSERLFRGVIEIFANRIVPPKPDEDSEEVDSSEE